MAEAIEQIDIGGPSLVRAAAKNHAFTTIATSPGQYAEILAQVTSAGATTLELRRKLAGEAFAHTAKYDRVIADYFAGQTAQGPFPGTITTTLHCQEVLRYGENPHQQAALYSQPGARQPNLVSARKLHGKELSYNNLLDLDSALNIVRAFSDPAAVVVKHNNPCGAAEATSLAQALRSAMAGDPLSAFGSVLGLNRTVDAATAEVLAEPGLFVEAIVAPDFQPEAFEILTTRPQVESQRPAVGGGRCSAGPAALGAAIHRRRCSAPRGRRPGRSGKPVEGRYRDPAHRGTYGRPAVCMGDGPPRKIQRDCPVSQPHAVGRWCRPDEPGRFDRDRHHQGGRPCRRLGAGLGCLLPVP